MKRSLRTLAAVAIACVSIPVFAIDLTPDQGSELRSRADGLLAERQGNPGWDGGTSRVNTRGDVKLNQNQGDVKARPHADVKPKVKGTKKPKESAGQKMKRAAKEMPGALVR